MSAPRRYAFYANTVTLLHFGWIALLFGGIILVDLHAAFAPIEFILLTLTLLATLPWKGACPLTLLEERLRKKIDGGRTGHKSFITTYTNKIFRTNLSPETMHLFVALLYICAYAFLVGAMKSTL